MQKIHRRHAGGVGPARGVVAVQHPRQRCAAHAGRARLRHRAEGGPARALYRPAQARATKSALHLEEIADVRPNAAFERDLAALGTRASPPCGSIPPTCAGGDRAARHRQRRRDRARRRSDRADEGGQERDRDCRRARGAAARRRGGDALPRLVRPRRAARRTHRDRRGRGAGKLSPRHRPPQGRFVSDHRRRRAERRHRALPRHPQHQPPHRAG